MQSQVLADENTKGAADRRIRPLVAVKALRRLIADPERTDEVFVIIRALAGRALERGYARFRQTPVGQRVLEEKRDLVEVLKDRDTLRMMPRGSLGRAYLGFVEREQITAEGLVDASEHEQLIGEEGLLRFATRQRDMHDLWHVSTGYGRDTMGEVCLLAFTYAQTGNRGLGVICLAGMLKHLQPLGAGVFPAVWNAYRAGRRATWLPGADWEALLSQPLDQVRSELGIEPPHRYERLLQNAALA